MRTEAEERLSALEVKSYDIHLYICYKKPSSL